MFNFSELKESFYPDAPELPVNQAEVKEVNQDGDQDLLKQIQEIKDLPSEAVANRYLFWDPKDAGESKKTLSRENAVGVLELLNEAEDFEESIDEEKAKQYLGHFFNKNFSNINYAVNTLKNWCSENPYNIKIINQEVISALNNRAEVSLPLLYFLSELSMYRQDPLLIDGGKPIEDLSMALNNGAYSFMPEFFDQLAVLGRVENKKANLELHKILDLEGIVRLDGEIIANDPTKGRELSWEVGFIGEKKSSLPGDVIGRVMAIGNALGQGRKNTGSKDYPEYYHNRESFTQELGNPEVFAKIVQFIRRQIEESYEIK